MASMFDWKVKFKCNIAFEEKLVGLNDKIKEMAYDGGCGTVCDFMEDRFGIVVKGISDGNLEGDSHYVGSIAILTLPENLWEEGMNHCSRCFISESNYSEGALSVSFYGPHDCKSLFELMVSNSDWFEGYEVSGGEGEEDCD